MSRKRQRKNNQRSQSETLRDKRSKKQERKRLSNGWTTGMSEERDDGLEGLSADNMFTDTDAEDFDPVTGMMLGVITGHYSDEAALGLPSTVARPNRLHPLGDCENLNISAAINKSRRQMLSELGSAMVNRERNKEKSQLFGPTASNITTPSGSSDATKIIVDGEEIEVKSRKAIKGSKPTPGVSVKRPIACFHKDYQSERYIAAVDPMLVRALAHRLMSKSDAHIEFVEGPWESDKAKNLKPQQMYDRFERGFIRLERSTKLDQLLLNGGAVHKASIS
jgi:hypothetical protein